MEEMGKEEGNQGIVGPTPQEVGEANKGLIRENLVIDKVCQSLL